MRSAAVTDPTSPGDAVNRFYEQASELVEAAAALRRQATAELALPACPSVLSCMEVALCELRITAATMACAVESEQLLRRGLDNLQVALDDASAAASAARALSSRVLARCS